MRTGAKSKLWINSIKVLLKVLTIPRRTEIEIVHVNFSASHTSDLITIISKMIQLIRNITQMMGDEKAEENALTWNVI